MKKDVRKRLRQLVLLTLMFTVVLAGCTPGSSKTEETADGRS